MCGIVGCVAEEPGAGILLEGLRRVEYRGYDSAGMVTINGGSLALRKGIGRVNEIEEEHELSKLKGNIGMAHTRWATHGGVTDENAHPHASCKELVAVIHNGIIENYVPLKKSLIAKGHRFRSETDTEVIAHLVEDEYKRTKDPVKATVAATKKLK
ncbi:MAG TPA: glutamine--fructose-6-phosphate transaminase (isomerizing), partial [Nitrososphaerales archaeon]